jgi:hypothetical protein
MPRKVALVLRVRVVAASQQRRSMSKGGPKGLAAPDAKKTLDRV